MKSETGLGCRAEQERLQFSWMWRYPSLTVYLAPVGTHQVCALHRHLGASALLPLGHCKSVLMIKIMDMIQFLILENYQFR